MMFLILLSSDTISSMKRHAHLYGKDEKGGSHGNRNFALLDSLFAAIEACLINGMDSSRNAILQFVPELFQTFLAASRYVLKLTFQLVFSINEALAVLSITLSVCSK